MKIKELEWLHDREDYQEEKNTIFESIKLGFAIVGVSMIYRATAFNLHVRNHEVAVWLITLGFIVITAFLLRSGIKSLISMKKKVKVENKKNILKEELIKIGISIVPIAIACFFAGRSAIRIIILQ